MNFFGYPIEIWLASFVAVMFKLKTNSNMSWFSILATVTIAMFSGVIMYKPIAEIFSLSASWNVPVAILIAVSAENLMKHVTRISNDEDFVKDWLKFILTRKVDYKERDKEKEKEKENKTEG